MKSLSEYDTIIFDLDNTLYDEREYLYAVNRAIREHILEKYHINLGMLLETQNYTTISGFIGVDVIAECLQIRRTVKVSLSLFHDAKELLKTLEDKKIYICTNGNPDQQRNKVSQLDWPEGITIITIYANETQPKPSAECLEGINGDCVFIGDSEIDEQTAKNANMPFIWSQQLFQ